MALLMVFGVDLFRLAWSARCRIGNTSKYFRFVLVLVGIFVTNLLQELIFSELLLDATRSDKQWCNFKRHNESVMEWSKLGKENKLLVTESNLQKFVNDEGICRPQKVVLQRQQYYGQRVISSIERTDSLVLARGNSCTNLRELRIRLWYLSKQGIYLFRCSQQGIHKFS